MRLKTAKILFIVGVLLQGGNSISADEPRDAESIATSGRHSSLTKTDHIHYEISFTAKRKENANVKIAQESNLQSNVFSKILLNKNDTTKLKAKPHLYLPNQSADMRVKELYPLRIEQVEQLVEQNSPELDIYRRKIEQEGYNLKQTKSGLLPTIDLNASPQYYVGDEYNDSKADTNSERLKTSLSIELNWSLLDPARSAEIAAAKDSYEKAKATYLIKLRDLQLQALNTYFLLQKSDEGVRIGEESILASEISLKDAKTRFESGLGTKLEVLEAETQLARDKQLLTSKQADQKINRSSLSEILNLQESIRPKAISPRQIIGFWNSTLEESIFSAYLFREELNTLRLDISINKSNANYALANSQPKISLFNTISKSYTEGEYASLDVDGSSFNNTVGVNAKWRFFDGGKANAKYKLSKSKAKESEARFANKRNAIRQEVSESFFKLKNASQDLVTSRLEIISTKESLRLARLRFKAGVGTQREVVNNQRDLTAAEVRYSDAITSYNTNLTELRRKTGMDYVACENDTKVPIQKIEISNDDLSNSSFPESNVCSNMAINNQD